jgi:hypothetical protein
MEADVAKESDPQTRGILGDINPVPAARDHIAGPSGIDDSDEETQRPRSRDGDPANHGQRAGTEVRGAELQDRHRGYGAISGNQPE